MLVKKSIDLAEKSKSKDGKASGSIGDITKMQKTQPSTNQNMTKTEIQHSTKPVKQGLQNGANKTGFRKTDKASNVRPKIADESSR